MLVGMKTGTKVYSAPSCSSRGFSCFDTTSHLEYCTTCHYSYMCEEPEAQRSEVTLPKLQSR